MSLRIALTRYQWQKLILFLLIASILTFALFYFFKTPQIKLTQNKIVEVQSTQEQHIQQTIRLIGTIHPKHTSVLYAKGTGKLDAVISTGQNVKKGTLIAKIENPDVEKNLALTIKAELLAKKQLKRLKPAYKFGYVSAREFEEKKQAWIDAQKDVAKTRMELDNQRFYAPFDGIIGAYKKREGSEVNQGEPVVTFYDPSVLVVDFDIPCSNLTRINEGQPVYIFNKKYSITHLQKMIDEDSHMCPADVDIICEQCLVGASVDVELVIAEKKNVIVIPYQALFLKNSKPFVYLVKKGQVVMVEVTTGLKQKDNIEITSGLQPGQLFITKGQERLYPGIVVDIQKSAEPNTI